jgi:ribosome-binding factor A
MAKPTETPEGRSVRLLRVGEQVRHVLSDVLMRGAVHDEILTSHSVSITEVRMSPDLRHATVFIKPLLGAAKLKFLPDDSFDEASHIEKLLAQPKVAQDIERDD